MQINPNLRSLTAVTQEQTMSAFMQKVYIWMTGGLILTGVIAFQVAHSKNILEWLFKTPHLFTALLFAELGVVLVMSLLVNRISATMAGALFVAYSALNGLTLSVVFLVYTAQSIAQVFFITAGMFGGMSLYGFMTKRDLTSIGSFMIMGLWGIVLASVVNLFFRNPAVSYGISFIGIFIFLGLTAYDTQKLKNLSSGYEDAAGSSDKPAIYGALTLYLDFINLFLMLLRVLGGRRR